MKFLDELKFHCIIRDSNTVHTNVSIAEQLQTDRGRIFELDASSMTGKIEYLEKYSVAPSPSRDYYGLKVLRDQVILYLWRISHGPHKTPVIRTTSFEDFTHDKSLQNEIQRIFGDYLLEHIENIISGRRNTLLTLPKDLIKNLVRYLSVYDIAKLSSLSHTAKEVFNDNFVWETLYKKYKPLTTNRYDKLYTFNYNWKQLVQQAQIERLMNEQKASRTRPTSKHIKITPKLEDTTKPFNVTSRGISRPVSSNASHPSKNPSENIRKRITANPVSKKLSDTHFERSIEHEIRSIEKKVPVIKSLQTIAQKNLRSMKEQVKSTKTEPKREENKDLINKSVETKSSKGQLKVRRTEFRTSSTSIRATEEKSSSAKPRSLASQSTIERQRSEKSSTITQDQSKVKTKSRAKKIGQSKSTILKTNTANIVDHSAIKDDSFDLADLIEASLRNIRSPRSIFDYNFSCIEKPKSCGGDSKLQEEYRKIMESSRGLKSGCPKPPLDRLSEKSEPLTAKSTKSTKSTPSTHRSDVSDGSTPKFTKTPKTKAKLVADLTKNPFKVSAAEDKNALDRYGIYGKYPAPSMPDKVEQKRSSSQKTTDKIELLRSLGSNDPWNKLGSGSKASDTNRYQLRKAVGNFYKQ